MRLQMSNDELSRLLAVELEISHDVAYLLAVSMLPGGEPLPNAWAEQRKLPPAILRRRYNWDLDRIDDRSCDREESEQRALAAVSEVAAYEQGAFLAPFFVEARPVFRMRHFVHGLARVIELDPIGSEARVAAVKAMGAVCQHAIDWPEEAVPARLQPAEVDSLRMFGKPILVERGRGKTVVALMTTSAPISAGAIAMTAEPRAVVLEPAAAPPHPPARAWQTRDVVGLNGEILGGYVLRCALHVDCDVVCDVEAYEVVGIASGGFPVEWAHLFERKGGDGPMDNTPDIEDAKVFLHGSVKWDGCADLLFNQEECMLHFCGPDSAASLGDLMRAVYAFAAEVIPNADWDIR